MTKIHSLILSIGLLLSSMAYTQLQENRSNNMIARIKITFSQEQIIVHLFDNPASKELLKQLPLSLNFSDYANTEKIAYLPNKLTFPAMPASQGDGDFTYYAPWGNIAIFYQGLGKANGLYTLGYIASGKEKLAAINHDFTAIIERIE